MQQGWTSCPIRPSPGGEGGGGDLEDILGLNLRSIACASETPYNVSFARPRPFQPPMRVTRLRLVGRLDVGQKGYDLALRALADPRWRGRQVTLNLYGDGEYKKVYPPHGRAPGAFRGCRSWTRQRYRHDLAGVTMPILMPSRI